MRTLFRLLYCVGLLEESKRPPWMSLTVSAYDWRVGDVSTPQLPLVRTVHHTKGELVYSYLKMYPSGLRKQIVLGQFWLEFGLPKPRKSAELGTYLKTDDVPPFSDCSLEILLRQLTFIIDLRHQRSKITNHLMSSTVDSLVSQSYSKTGRPGALKPGVWF